MSRETRYFTFHINPVTYTPTPKNGLVTQKLERYNAYKKELRKIARAIYFNASASVKVVFIIPHYFTTENKTRNRLNGNPVLSDKWPLYKLIEGLRDGLITGKYLTRVDAAVYWGDKGKIIIKNIEEKDFDILRRGLDE